MKRILLAATLGSYIVTASGQAPASRPAFEAASIKLGKETDGSDSESTPGRFRMQGTLRAMIRIAYGVRIDQVEGGPKWLDQDHYEIDARAEGPAQDSQLLAMLQTLLAERFKLEFHRETKSLSGYALFIAKNGLKMTEVSPGSSHTTHGATGSLTAANIRIADLATRLTRLLGMPVSDETGNSGFFDFKLTWAPDKSSPSPSVADPAADSAGASIFTALQEQLGLKLEPRKVPVETLVVDRAEKPIVN